MNRIDHIKREHAPVYSNEIWVSSHIKREYARRMVHGCAVRLNNKQYIAADDTSAAVLHQLNGQEVIVAYDPQWLNDVAVLDLSGHPLCHARLDQVQPNASASGGKYE